MKNGPETLTARCSRLGLELCAYDNNTTFDVYWRGTIVYATRDESKLRTFLCGFEAGMVSIMTVDQIVVDVAKET